MDEAGSILSKAGIEGTPTTWKERYGKRHQQIRITDFPSGIAAPKKVRIYRRREHYILQWWDKRERRTLSDRVDGDLVAAISRAREIDERLECFRTAGTVSRRRLPPRDLVRRFCRDLDIRANAGEIDPRTGQRYVAALNHFLGYAESPAVATKYRSAGQVNREFALGFAAYLNELRVAPNGHPQASARKMAAPKYVEGVVRAMFGWAADPDRGNVLPPGFRNPFSAPARRSADVAPDLFGEPDITAAMATQLLAACDAVQLPLFATILLYGLRASEPCFLFCEDLDLSGGWLKVPCRPDLGYVTKGRREKHLPLISPLSELLEATAGPRRTGLLFLRRTVLEGRESPPLLGATVSELTAEFERRCRQSSHPTAKERLRIRNRLFNEAGGQNYDRIADEFHTIARALKWPAVATVKDLRHLAATSFENCGMPLFSRRYLLGQSPGREAIVSYTHVNELRRHYEETVEKAFPAVIEAATCRGRDLALLDRPRLRSTVVPGGHGTWQAAPSGQFAEGAA